MSLAEALAAEDVPPTKGPLCSVARLLSTLSEDDAATLRGALSDPRVKTSTIQRALRRNGDTLAEQTIGRHRRGGCACR